MMKDQPLIVYLPINKVSLARKKKKKVGVKENVDVPPNYGLLVGWYICDNKMMDYTLTKKKTSK